MFLVLLAAVLSIAVEAEGSDYLWSRRFGDANAQAGYGVAADTGGNVLLTGFFAGTVDFGGVSLTSAGAWDTFVAKFNASGNHIWSKRFGDASAQAGRSLVADAFGNVIAAGVFAGTVNFGGGSLTSAGQNDIFLVKLNAFGNHLWSKRFGDADNQDVFSVAVDTAGNVFITGFIQGATDFGGGSLTSAGGRDIYLAKFDANGNHLWSRLFGDAAAQIGRGVATDSSGDVAMVGEFNGTVDLGSGALTSAGSSDLFLARYDSDGNCLWSRSFGDASDQRGRGVAIDASGSEVVTGDFAGTVDFGGGPLTSAAGMDAFLAKHDSGGNHVWSRAFGGAGTDGGTALAIDGSGNTIVTGHFFGTVDFGGGPIVGAGGSDIFVARYGPSGRHLTSGGFGDASNQYALSVALDGPGSPLVTGYFQGTIDFGGGPLTSAGGDDIFLAKFVDLIFEDGFE